jgi:hypothetical protein
MASEASTPAAPAKKELTAERLRELFRYDAATGAFTQIAKSSDKSNGSKIGSVVGSADSLGYLRVGIDRRLYKLHRLAWLYVYGEWPSGRIDHINRNPSDNRIANLRVATPAQNRANSRNFNRCRLKGVARNRNQWLAQISYKNKNYYLGNFSTPEEAHAAYCRAAAEMYGEFACFESASANPQIQGEA